MDPSTVRILNLGVVAHVDAGKTTLTERLLHLAGASERIGRVDHGDTITDNDELERERGITIRSAVAALNLDDLHVNLIDTPGHSDFVAEVERALAVLDGVVLVVSAVEGVQAHTRVLIKVLLRLQLPFLIFVNKIDRAGARDLSLVAELRRLLAGSPLIMTTVDQLATTAVSVSRTPSAQLAERIAELDDQLLDDYVSDRWPPTSERIAERLRELVSNCKIQPVFFGAALGGAGVEELISDLRLLAPDRDPGGPIQAEVFKVAHASSGDRQVFVRMNSGRLRPRMRLSRFRRTADGTIEHVRQLITGVARFDDGGKTQNGSAGQGDIALIKGLHGPRIGDQLGTWQPPAAVTGFRRPGMEAVVSARNPGQVQDLREALRLLTEEDPLIDVRLDDHDHRLTISLYGEIQRQVITERLRREYGIDAVFSEPTPAYLERVVGVGESISPFGEFGFAASVGFRVEPRPLDEPVACDREIEHGALPRAFFTAITETVSRAVQQGPHGWSTVGCRIVIIAADYAYDTTGGDFRDLVPLVLARALIQAGTQVCEPYSSVEVDLPADSYGPVLALLGRLRATDQTPSFDPSTGSGHGSTGSGHGSTGSGHDGLGAIEAILPTGNVPLLEQQLDSLTAGQGTVAAQPADHRPMARPWPRRSRTDGNPYQPTGYLRSLNLR